VQEQKLHHLSDLWIEGVEDYIQHARSLLIELAAEEASNADNPETSINLQRTSPYETTTAPMAAHRSKGNTTTGVTVIPTASLGVNQQDTLAKPQSSLIFSPQPQQQLVRNGAAPLGLGISSGLSASQGMFSFLGNSSATPSSSATEPAPAASAPKVSFPVFGATSAPFSFGQNVNSSSALTDASAFSWGNSAGASGVTTCQSISTDRTAAARVVIS